MAEFTDKPYKWFVDKPDGTRIIMRRAYDPRYFAFPSRELEHFDHIRNNAGIYGGSADVLDEYDGVLSYYHQVRRFERDDKRWILLRHPGEYAVEVELTRRQLGEIRPLSPEEAWRLARELDRGETRYPIEVEPGSALP
jgi:hypothetical protein